MSIDFPDFPHTMDFVAFSRTVGNLWGNPYISHMLKYTIRWESDGKKALILWEKYDYRFTRLSHTMAFVAFSRTMRNLWVNLCISYMITIRVPKVPFHVFKKLENKIQKFIVRFCFYLNMKNEIQIFDNHYHV